MSLVLWTVMVDLLFKYAWPSARTASALFTMVIDDLHDHPSFTHDMGRPMNVSVCDDSRQQGRSS
jgi:hypothetical protein